MVTIVKHEWHQVDEQYAIELDEDLLSEIYPELDEDEIQNLLEQIENGEIDVEDIVDEAYNNDVDLEWDHQYSDNWTMRKGGYDVTYEIGDESSWHHNPEPDPPYYKCTNCKWSGGKYDTETAHLREDGSVIEDYYSTDEESHSTKQACPMCDHDIKLTEFGEQQEKEWEERRAKWEQEEDEEEIEESYHAECTSCTWTGPEADTITVEGQMCCPDCREPVWTAEQVSEHRKEDLEKAMEELKDEFERLINQEDLEDKKDV